MPITPFLRDGPNRDPAIQEHIAQMRARLASTDDVSQQVLLCGHIGDLYRAAGDYDKAACMLTKALTLARRERDERRIVANLLRLATTWQYDGKHAMATELFHDALERTSAPSCQDYADFAWQHLGKCLAEQGQLAAAMQCFAEAYRLRVTKGNAALLASTERALAALHDRAREQSV